MSKPNVRYLIVALLPDDFSSQIEAIQKQYENKLWRVIMPPHVTLLRPGTALVDETAAVEQFAGLRLPQRELRLQANRIGIFANGPDANVIYLAVEPNWALTSLHQALLQSAGAMMEAKEDYGRYVPHITLANNVADEESVNEIVSELEAKNLAVDFSAEHIYLFKKADTDPRWVQLAKRALT